MKSLYYHVNEGMDGWINWSGRKRYMTEKSADQANRDLVNITDGGWWVTEKEFHNLNKKETNELQQND